MAFDNLKLEKGMYTTAKGFSAALEELDPSGQYEGTPMEGLDAFQRQLKRFDIRVGGSGSDVVEKFFQTSDSAALFPEYIARAVKQGMEETELLSKIVATKTKISALDYRSIVSEAQPEDKELVGVAEGAVIPETTIRTRDELVQLVKRGRMLVASYEAVRYQHLDLFTVTLRQIGAYIARSQFRDAVAVLTENLPAENTVSAAGLDYEALIALWNAFDPYQMGTLLGSPAVVGQMLNLPEFRDANAGLHFHATGDMITPFGAQLLKHTALEDGCLLGLDERCALEMVQADEITTDFDKLIDRQLERAAITSTAGFSRICDGAVKRLDIQ
ncbi:MAG: phage major capsid protein [Clostridiales bacterium]|nr:phage major capsid protein [Clostridiales bacterium]